MAVKYKWGHVSDKALLYTSNNRAGLRHHELVAIIQENRLVHLGTRGIEFYLAWDSRRNEPIVLLIARGVTQDVLVSI